MSVVVLSRTLSRTRNGGGGLSCSLSSVCLALLWLWSAFAGLMLLLTSEWVSKASSLWAGFSSPGKKMAPGSVGVYFYLYREPSWLVRQQVALIQAFLPGAAVYIGSDNGSDYEGVCRDALRQQRAMAGGNDSASMRSGTQRPFTCRAEVFKEQYNNIDRTAGTDYCVRWTTRLRDVVLWLNSSWVVLHEGDSYVLGTPYEPHNWVSYLALANSEHSWSGLEGRPGFEEELTRRCGATPGQRARGYAAPGGFMFRTEAFMDAWDRVRNASLTWVTIQATDTCISGMLQLGCHFGISSRDFYQPLVGPMPLWKERLLRYRPWPYGNDLNQCYACLAACGQRHCQEEIHSFEQVIDSVVRRGCPCPALLHSIHGGLCAARDYQGDGETLATILQVGEEEDRVLGRSFLACLSVGACSSSRWHRPYAIGLHCSLCATSSILLLCRICVARKTFLFLLIAGLPLWTAVTMLSVLATSPPPMDQRQHLRMNVGN